MSSLIFFNLTEVNTNIFLFDFSYLLPIVLFFFGFMVITYLFFSFSMKQTFLINILFNQNNIFFKFSSNFYNNIII